MTTPHPVRTICVPQVIVCSASEEMQVVARSLRDSTSKIIVFPARGEILAFIQESATTFQCESPLVISDIIVELGFCVDTEETLKYVMKPAMPHIMEKSLNDMGVSIRPLND